MKLLNFKLWTLCLVALFLLSASFSSVSGQNVDESIYFYNYRCNSDDISLIFLDSLPENASLVKTDQLEVEEYGIGGGDFMISDYQYLEIIAKIPFTDPFSVSTWTVKGLGTDSCNLEVSVNKTSVILDLTHISATNFTFSTESDNSFQFNWYSVNTAQVSSIDFFFFSIILATIALYRKLNLKGV